MTEHMKTITAKKTGSYSMNLGEFPLEPIVSSWMESIFGNPRLVKTLSGKFGSPMNLHHLSSFSNNIENYRAVFKKYDLNAQIFFARKANKSRSLVKRALDDGIGVDTASYKELGQGIELGGGRDNLVLTAAIKTEPMIRLAVRNCVPIVADNKDELLLIDEVAKNERLVATIGIRLSGFEVNGEKLYSRFGFDIANDRNLLKEWFTDHPRFHNLQLTGLHFHLDNYSTNQRAEAILQSLAFKQFLEEGGTSINFLDIGGGILMNYLKDKLQWENFVNALKDAVLGERESITFNNDGLGFEKNESSNSIIGKLKTYPYFNEINSTSFLEEIFRYEAKSTGKNVAETIRENTIQLRIEPGRSMLCQVGITLARVAHRKKDANGQWLVGLEMNMSQLRSSSRDFLVDPIMIYNREPESKEGFSMFFTGAYCLEQDVILKRRLKFPALPDIGDHVAFINTGGYMMHFYETEAHLFDLSKNLYVTGGNEVTFDAIHVD